MPPIVAKDGNLLRCNAFSQEFLNMFMNPGGFARFKRGGQQQGEGAILQAFCFEIWTWTVIL